MEVRAISKAVTRAKRLKTLSASVQTMVERDIVLGRFKPGDRLDEEELAKVYETSRTPICEALRSLASVGMVSIRPRRGAVVVRPTVSEIVEAFEIVAELEALAARLACERADDARVSDIGRLHQICKKAALTGTADEYLDANNRFHEAIWKASGNTFLVEQIRLVERRLAPYRHAITFEPGRQLRGVEEHEDIAVALSKRDPATAAISMRKHVMILADDALNLARNLRL